MSELGEALRKHPTPGGEEAPRRVIAAAQTAVGRPRQKAARPRWLSGPAAVLAALALAGPAAYAIAESVQGGGIDVAQVQAIEDARTTEAAIDAMWLDTAVRADAGELHADVDQERAAATLRTAVDPPADDHAANQLEEDMIALTAKLRESGDLPQPGQFDSTWGQVPIAPTDIRSGIVPFDPESCPAVAEAFSDAGLEPPMVYSDECP